MQTQTASNAQRMLCFWKAGVQVYKIWHFRQYFLIFTSQGGNIIDNRTLKHNM